MCGAGHADHVADELASVDREAAETVYEVVQGTGAVFVVAHYPRSGAVVVFDVPDVEVGGLETFVLGDGLAVLGDVTLSEMGTGIRSGLEVVEKPLVEIV